MKLEIKNTPKKLAIFWVGKNETPDGSAILKLKHDIKNLKDDNYQAFIIESGKETMKVGVSGLLENQTRSNTHYYT